MALAFGANYHTCAIATGGSLKCWGRNYEGQLGIGGTGQQDSPADVPGVVKRARALAVEGL